MKLNQLKTLGVAAIALVFMGIPAMGSAQVRYNHDEYRFSRDQRDLKNQIDQMERESNAFRFYFEHNFRSNGHKETHYDSSSRDAHPEHMGRNGNMTLKDAIQNLDEDFERLRSEVDRHGRTTARAHELMSEIMEHMQDVDVRINRVSVSYNYNGRERNWRYDRSELSNRWNDFKSDLQDLNRQVNRRGR